VSGETTYISAIIEFQWYKWVKLCEMSVSFPEDAMVLSCDLSPALDISPHT
jgi:hypothetical protein